MRTGAQNRLRRRRRALHLLDEVLDQPSVVNLIHYSCESLDDRPSGTSPRITSIAVRNLGSNSTSSFSIHRVAERNGISASELEQHYDRFERKMLDEFDDFVRRHLNYKWLHWNMRDSNFGFEAIEHRYRVLGGTPTHVPEAQRIDLAGALIDIYGPGYAGHPRMERLIEINGMSKKDFLGGRDEAAAFESKAYVKLHQSTLRKIDIFANILARQEDGTLKTLATWKDKYGATLIGITDAATEHWLFKTLAAISIITSITCLFL